MNAAASPWADEAGELSYHMLRAALKHYGKTPVELDSVQSATAVRQARKEYALERRVLASEEARDVVVPDSMVSSALDTIVQRYPDGESFLSDLKRNRMDVARFRDALHRELRVDAVLDRIGGRAADISELDAMIYYYAHRDKFERPETRAVRHILVTTNPDFPENERTAARKRIETVARRVRSKPQRFAEQAMKHSECPTALEGGTLGRLPRGQLHPELDQALFALEEGCVSDVVESPLGFHLIYCERINAAGAVPVKEALPQIREKLLQRRRRMCQRAWLASLAGADTGKAW